MLKCQLSSIERFLQRTVGCIQAPPGHLKGLQATSKWQVSLIDHGCCHGKGKQINESN